MDTKDSGSSNVKTTSSATRATNIISTSDAPNSNIVETSRVGGTDVKTVDMSGTNLPNATNAKAPEERAQDVRIVDGATKDSSAPVPNEVVSGNPVSTDYRVGETEEVSAPKLPTVKVRLFGNHTHEGIDFEKGDIIEVDEQSAKYLETVENGARV